MHMMMDSLRDDEGRKRFVEGWMPTATEGAYPVNEVSNGNTKASNSNFQNYFTGSNVWSWVNPKLELKGSEKSGQGHFVKVPVKKDEPLVCWAGRIVHKGDLHSLSQDEYDFILQVDDEFFQAPFMHPYHEPADFINHSCNPTAGFGGSPITLVALRDIGVGEEITFDYCMDTSYDMEFDCLCGSLNCRKKVTGNDWKLPALQQKYEYYFSPYLWKKIYKSNLS